MRVKIGPYISWIGPYQIADWLRHVGVSEDRCHDIGEILSKTWLDPVCQWIYNKRKRTVKVKLDDYDTWNLDDTLALIIGPCLRQLKETSHGTPRVDIEDLPEELRSEGEYSSKAWAWVIDEMIWTFEALVDDEIDDFDKDIQARIKRGLTLFAKYYQALWD